MGEVIDLNPADGPEAGPSRVILPGQDRGPVPVDPNDPTKGVKVAIYNAAQLSAAVDELANRTERLAEGLMHSVAQTQQIAVEVGEVLAHLTTLVLPLAEMGLPEKNDAEDEAYETLRTFLEARAEALSEIEQQMEQLNAAREAAESGEQPDLFVAPDGES